MKIRVLMIDDHTLFLAGLEDILAREEDIEVVGVAGLTRTSTCAKPPGSRPTRILQNSNRRSLTVPAFIRLAARMNSGTASST